MTESFVHQALAGDAETTDAWLAPDTECGALIAALDWSTSPLGDIAGWPASLRTAVSIAMRSPAATMVMWGAAGVMLYNDAFIAIAGARHPSTFGMPVREGWPEVADFSDNVLRVVLSGSALSYTAQPLTLMRNGVVERVTLNLDYMPVFDEDGRPAGVFSVNTEIADAATARNRQQIAEAALIGARDRARDVLENMIEGFVLFDHGFRVIDINSAALRFDELTRDDVIGRTHLEIWPGMATSALGAMCATVMRERTPAALEYHFHRPDGREHWLDMRAYPVAEGLALFYRDVTDRRQAQEAATAAAGRLQLALAAGAIVGTWVWDDQAKLIVTDHRCAQTFGLDPERCSSGVLLEYLTAAIHPDDQSQATLDIAAALGTGGAYRSQYRAAQSGDAYRWIESNGTLERDSAGVPTRFAGVLVDIDDRRAAEAERDRATALLATFAEAVPGVVFAKDRAGRLIFANNGTAGAVGKPLSACIGRTDDEFLDDKDEAARIIATDRRIMETGIGEQVQEPVRHADGTEAVWYSTKEAMRDAAGTIIGLVGSSVDITARVTAERALAEALETADTLLHEVNHRVKNSLQIVTSLLMLQARQAKDPALTQALLEARGRISVIASMHQRLYSTSQHDRVDFGEYVGDMVVETIASLGSNGRIVIETRIEPGIVVVLNHAVSLALVVTELVINAIKYGFPGNRSGTICVSLVRRGTDIVLTVADDGIGLPAEFDAGAGTSLGMKIVTALVRQVRGKLTVRSANLPAIEADCTGTVFEIDIPTAGNV